MAYISDENDTSDSSRYCGKIREAELIEQAALQEYQKKADEFAKECILEEQGVALAEEFLAKKKEELLDDTEWFLDGYEELLQNEALLDSTLDKYSSKPIKKWLFLWLKKLKELLSKLLSLKKSLEQEIEDLKDKLGDNELSEQEKSKILERVRVLQKVVDVADEVTTGLRSLSAGSAAIIQRGIADIVSNNVTKYGSKLESLGMAKGIDIEKDKAQKAETEKKSVDHNIMYVPVSINSIDLFKIMAIMAPLIIRGLMLIGASQPLMNSDLKNKKYDDIESEWQTNQPACNGSSNHTSLCSSTIDPDRNLTEVSHEKHNNGRYTEK
ncbi:hypothetical protein [Wolbachia pipientis]|uniref:hypothetical protein n=1 Tax=Wolbachia pipientis TaxID=955 RepID=UPI0011D0F67C|nr:hypothetical protein [Wolbachia pipientis]